ncbi:hypothetical protein NPIL_638161 [Nephila pilipes]|uniref:Uncharacterized protein n=1 Tax=Nephila pilipes TaxID=299642 RepID=A0A8X6TRJ4_NEPPI|nr:hypothetical protein NPIL_638161 [Nephila pilipes]
MRKRLRYKHLVAHRLLSSSCIREAHVGQFSISSSYYLSDQISSTGFEPDRCADELQYNALFRKNKLFLILQCCVIPNCIRIIYSSYKFVALVVYHPEHSPKPLSSFVYFSTKN